jgi:hypothetical protein
VNKFVKPIILCSVFIIFVTACANRAITNIQAKTKIFEDVTRYAYMYKDEIINELGSEYEIVETGAEGVCVGYHYNHLGLTFTFGDQDVAWIDCDEKVDINGARAGMNFTQVQEILGKTFIEKTWVETPENTAYQLIYEANKCLVFFLSYYEDGRDTEVFVMANE